jgi:MFS superfamily sulfate permease-like transporter
MQSETIDTKPKLSTELSAAVLLLLVALPLNIGVAIAAGVPAEVGLFSGFIGAVVTGGLSRCAVLVSGPDAGIGALVLEMLQQHGVQALGPLVLIAGLIQLLIGLFKQSRWFRAVSPAVVSGMLLGMGLLIIVTQFHIMLDDAPKGTGLDNLILIPQAIWNGIAAGTAPHNAAALLGLASILIAWGWSRCKFSLAKVLPPALVAIVLAAIAAELMHLPVQKVALPKDLGLTMIYADPAIWKMFLNPAIWISAVTLSCIISAQTTITVKALETASGGQQRFNYDRELISQGVGNLISGFICGLPVAGVLLRSSANIQSGAKTKIPNVTHGVLMLIAALAFPRMLEYIPTCALAAILVFIGCRMVHTIQSTVVAYPMTEKIILGLTVGAILITNLFTGVVFGLAIALGCELYRLMHLSVKVEPVEGRRAVALKLSGAATFAHIPHLLNILQDLSEDFEVHLHLEEVTYLDHAVLNMFMEWELDHRDKLVIDWESAGNRAPQKARAEEPVGSPYLFGRRPTSTSITAD